MEKRPFFPQRTLFPERKRGDRGNGEVGRQAAELVRRFNLRRPELLARVLCISEAHARVMLRHLGGRKG